MFLWFSLLLFRLAELAVRRLLLLTEGEPHESRVPEALWTERTNTADVLMFYKTINKSEFSSSLIMRNSHF